MPNITFGGTLRLSAAHPSARRYAEEGGASIATDALRKLSTSYKLQNVTDGMTYPVRLRNR